MVKRKNIIWGVGFLVVALYCISSTNPLIFPTREINISHGPIFGPVLKGYVFVQEITLKKKYLDRIDLFFAKIPSPALNNNVFLLLDDRYRILHTKNFSSADIDKPDFYPFGFKKRLEIGRGKKVFVCVYSTDSDMSNYIAFPRKPTSEMETMKVFPVLNNDPLISIQNQGSALDLKGTLGLKTYESGRGPFSLFQIILYVLAFLITMMIIFAPKVKLIILHSDMRPEYAFLAISLVFGFLFVYFTPPFQVPDEPAHLYRSFQVADLNLFKTKDSIPKSLMEISQISDRMKFKANEKTNRKEILSLAEIKLNDTIKTKSESPDYVMPYIPQALGVAAGKILGLAPLWFFYLGRITNLLISVVLLFIAIRLTPVLKWLFFLLAVMPMTLNQMASLSYDAPTFAISFLLIAFILKLALNGSQQIKTSDMIWLFLISLILALCKPPYYLIVFTFLLIPVKKIGSRKRYLTLFVSLILSALVVSQLWSVSRTLGGSMKIQKTVALMSNVSLFPETRAEKPAPSPEPNEFPSRTTQSSGTHPRQESNSAPAVKPVQPDSTKQAPAEENVNPYDPPAQKKFILEDPFRYLGIIYDTVVKYIGLYLMSFVGLFGWVDTPLPKLIIGLYLLFLLVTALTSHEPGIRIGFRQKAVLFTIFLTGFVLIETAMYIYCNPVGCNPITAVQGRYFIALAPLFYLLFYNSRISAAILSNINRTKQKTGKEKRNIKSNSDKTHMNELLFHKSSHWMVAGFAVFSLIYSLYLIIGRFYIVTI